jgi:photosystem II stability/assembly factor-like uncharacterized protein
MRTRPRGRCIVFRGMAGAVVLLAVVGFFAGGALAGDESRGSSEVAFARLQTSSLGLAATYEVVACGASCSSYTPHVFVTNESRSWREVTPPNVLSELEDVVFSTPLIGWIAANDCSAARAFVYRTTTGGRTWRSTAVPATNCSAGSRLDLSFSDNRHGWILNVFENGNRAPLQRTLDGGKTWSEVMSSAPVTGKIAFVTRRDGWLARSDFALPQQLYATRDGGRRWRRLAMQVPRGWRGAQVFPDVPTFFGQRGVIPVSLVRSGRTAVAFYVTCNGGQTWRLRAIRPVAFTILAPHNPFVRYVPTSIASPNVWWIAAGRKHSLVAVTTDAGRSWRVSTLSSLPSRAASDISASDARHAWLTTSQRRSATYVTGDGGDTWHHLKFPLP